MTRRLALFDLDNTLLEGDSDHAWGEFLIASKLVDPAIHRARNDDFYQDYLDGRLDIHAYVAFTLAPVLGLTRRRRERLYDEYLAAVVRPMMLDKARKLVARHRDAGDFCVIITATNSFITGPIAREFAVDKLLATELERQGDDFTGRIAGIPCYQAGKVLKLEQWLGTENNGLSLADSIFYSDSINDIELMDRVTEAVAVDPDSELLRLARERGWKVISLRE